MDNMAQKEIKIRPDQSSVIEELSKRVETVAKSAIGERGIFTVGLSGGSLCNFLSTGLPTVDTDWSKWKLFFCDERHVSFDNSDSTFGVYKESLIKKTPLEEGQFVVINASLSVEEAAVDYTNKMKEIFGECDWPVFDLLLLGMGPDGHTCSLFPGHPLLEEETRWIAPISDSPKPPPCRITMTFPVINAARLSMFAACGSGKSDMVQRVLEGGDTPPLPASRVNSQKVVWLLDEPAAAKLTNRNNSSSL